MNKIIKHKSPPKKVVMENWYYIATYVLALIAIAGFVFSIVISRNTSKTTEKLVNGLTSFVEPVLKFSSITFLPSPQFLDCQNPPKVINYTYKNTSNIPIKVRLKSIEAFYGDKPIFSGHRPKMDSKTIILAPGENWGVVTQSIDQAVQELMKGKTGIFNPPFIKVELKAIISNLDELKKYDIFLIHQIGIDCNSYKSGYNITCLLESYVQTGDK